MPVLILRQELDKYFLDLWQRLFYPCLVHISEHFLLDVQYGTGISLGEDCIDSLFDSCNFQFYNGQTRICSISESVLPICNAVSYFSECFYYKSIFSFRGELFYPLAKYAFIGGIFFCERIL